MSQTILEDAVNHWIDSIDDDYVLAKIAARAMEKIAAGEAALPARGWVLHAYGDFRPVALIAGNGEVTVGGGETSFFALHNTHIIKRWQRGY